MLTQENEENRKELAELRLVREMVHDTQVYYIILYYIILYYIILYMCMYM